MSPNSTSRLAALVAAVTALSVLSAGCVVQDRPAHQAFSIVADAGEDQVVAVGETAHFEWDEHHAVDSEGEHAPEVELEYVWRSSQSAEPISQTSSASISRATPGLEIVAVEVGAEGAKATDAAGVLFVPPDTDTGKRAFVAVTGSIHFWEDPHPDIEVHEVEFEGTPAAWAEVDLESVQSRSLSVVLDFSEVDVLLGSEVEGTVLVAVRFGAGPATVVGTGPVFFDPSNYYSVRIPANGSTPTLGQTVRGESGLMLSSFDDFAAGHAAEGEVSAPVTESQTLPGFGAAAAVAAVAAAFVVAAVALAARRRD